MNSPRAQKPRPQAILKVRLPEELVALLGQSREQAEAQLQLLALIELFRRGEVSSGYAAETLGISRWDFIKILGEHDVPYFDMTEDELRQEVQAARTALRGQAHN